MYLKPILKKLENIVVTSIANTVHDIPSAERGRWLDGELRKLLYRAMVYGVNNYVDGALGSGWDDWKLELYEKLELNKVRR